MCAYYHRLENACPFCYSEDVSHNRTRCLEYENYVQFFTSFNYIREQRVLSVSWFRQFLDISSPKKYVERKLEESILKSNDECGFRSSGILPYFYYQGEIYIYLIHEEREGKWTHNIIGGKRAVLEIDGEWWSEPSIDTALNEAHEELRNSENV